MYTRPLSAAPELIKKYRAQFIIYLFYVSAIYVAYGIFKIEEIDIKMSIATVLGFSISLLLGFRTAASYDRWWEARKVWGGIVNDSRTLIRQLIGFTGKGEIKPEVKKLTYYMIAWCYALKNGLRNINPLEGLEEFLSQEELKELSSKSNKHNEILKLMQLKLAQLRANQSIDSFQYVSLDNTLKQLCDHMGKCERIKNTIFPEHYRAYTHWGITIFMIMLPYGMLFSTGPFVILICMIVNFFFLMIESIAFSLQSPFQNSANDTPMSALSRTIEINLLEMIDAPNIPAPLQPDKKGVLM